MFPLHAVEFIIQLFQYFVILLYRVLTMHSSYFGLFPSAVKETTAFQKLAVLPSSGANLSGGPLLGHCCQSLSNTVYSTGQDMGALTESSIF